MYKGKVKHLWLDTETLSFDQNQADIIQLAGMLEVDNQIVDKFNYFIKPACMNIIEPNIWEFHQEHLGVSQADIMAFPDQLGVFNDFKARLNKYVDIKDKTDRLIISGYNCIFDRNKVLSWFKHNGDNFMFAYFSGRMLDVYHILAFLLDDLALPSFKLEKVWQYMVDNNIVNPIKGTNHSAITDIKQTYILYKKICEPAKELFKQSL